MSVGCLLLSSQQLGDMEVTLLKISIHYHVSEESQKDLFLHWAYFLVTLDGSTQQFLY